MPDSQLNSVFLNQLFGGQTGIGGDPAMNAFSRTIGQNDYWKMAAAPIGAAKFNTSTWDAGTTAGVSAAQGFLSALLAGYGQRREAEQMDAVRAILPQLRAGENVPNPGVDPEAYSGLQLNIENENIDRQAAAALKAQEFKTKIAETLFGKRPDLAAQALGLDTTKPVGADTSFDPSSEKGLGLENGRQATSSKIKKYYKEFLDADMPPVQAAAAAKQQVEGEIKANNKSFDEAKSAREYGNQLLALANTAKAGMSQAGITGNYQTIRHAADYLLGNEDKLTGDQVLSSIAPEIVKMNRSPGAVSDFETKLYLGAGPSVYNTPETNAILAQKMEDLGKLNVEYADFLEAYREANSGSTLGAAKKWQEYKTAFPIFKGDTANIQLNTDRPSWQEFFAGVAETPQTTTTTTSSGASGMTPEQARAKLKELGVPGY